MEGSFKNALRILPNYVVSTGEPKSTMPGFAAKLERYVPESGTKTPRWHALRHAWGACRGELVGMASVVWVKVVGFNDVERHSLNTLFRLSERIFPSYVLWTRDAPSPPRVVLMDMDSYEAELELASPSFNPHIKLICVGDRPPADAWRVFARPVEWPALVQVLDGLFSNQGDVDVDIGLDAEMEKPVPPGVRVSLLVGLLPEERMYMRARLAIAGLTDVDEADTAAQALERTRHRRYNLVVLSLDVTDSDPWVLVDALNNLPEPPHAVVVATGAPTWFNMERAEQQGCMGLLEIPFNPRQVVDLLQKV